MHFTFRSDRPDLSDTELAFDSPADRELARQYDTLINSRAYLDPFDRGHIKAVADAQALAETLYGDGPVVSEFQGCGFTFNTATGEPVKHEFTAPVLATGQGQADEHNRAA